MTTGAISKSDSVKNLWHLHEYLAGWVLVEVIVARGMHGRWKLQIRYQPNDLAGWEDVHSAGVCIYILSVKTFVTAAHRQPKIETSGICNQHETDKQVVER